MTGIFEERDKARMCDEIAAFFREEHDLELWLCIPNFYDTGRCQTVLRQICG